MSWLTALSDAMSRRRRDIEWEVRHRLRGLRRPVPDATGPASAWKWAAEAVGACVTAALALYAWLADRGPAETPLPDGSPGWARVRDLLLEGPDAGAWASNANALVLGRLDDLDAHRLPVYPYLTAFASNLYPDVAVAGHVVNHACYLLLGPVVYLLGRRWMSPGMAFGAAVTAVLYPAGIQAGQRFGVDPVVTTALPLALLGAELGAWRWWVAPLGGLVCGVAATSHLTTIGVPFVGLLLCLFRGRPGAARWLGTLGFAGGVLVGVGGMFWSYPTLPMDILRGTLAEGVAPAGGGAGTAGFVPSVATAWRTVQAGLPQALEDVMGFVAARTRPGWLPWGAALVVPWLGLVGGALGDRGRFEWRRIGAGLAVGVPLVLGLVPLLAFAAAESPDRYSDNFFPLVALLVFRGLDAVTSLVEVAIRRGAAGWPLGTVGVIVGVGIAWGIHKPARVHSSQPNPADVAVWQVGAIVRQNFPPGGGASCTDREVDAYAGRVFCPHSPLFLYAKEPEPVRALLSAECSGEGPVPYVIIERVNSGEPVSADREKMDAWVTANGVLKGDVVLASLKAHIYAVERVTAPGPATP